MSQPPRPFPMAWHKRLLGTNPTSREWYWSNPDTGEVALEMEWYGLEKIAADAKERRLTAPSGWKGDLHHVAWVPTFAVDKVWREEGINLLKDKDRLRRWLLNPDNAAFRTKEGQI